MADDSLARFRAVLAAAYAELEGRREELNDLNVFPVADGDTGDNMSMTMRAVLEELDALDGRPLEETGRDELVAAVARAALLGARGNSGVILSQIVRGAAEELASRPGELVDPVLVSAALARAVDAAYASVREPAEGTMLSAIAAMAHGVAQELAHIDRPRLGADATAAEQDAILAGVLERAVESGKEAVRRGPEQLAVLREADVVDAGAYGLTVIVAGVAAALRGESAATLDHQPPPRVSLHTAAHEASEFRYCTNFAVTGEGLSGNDFAARLEAIGDSVLVVGDDHTVRVHVHTDEPEDARAVFAGAGEVSRFEFTNMEAQVAERRARLEEAGAALDLCGVVAVASGGGVRRLFEDLGAHVVDGGATMNPSTNEILGGIRAVAAREVVVLPNSPNVILAAERAAELAERRTRVVPTRAPQTGLVALLAFDPAEDATRNAERVEAAADAVRAGGVAEAARDDRAGRFAAGEAVAYEGDELVAWGEPREALAQLLGRLAEGAEVLTCLEGEGAPLDAEAVEALVPEGIELDLHAGGQPAWWWLLSAE